MSNNPTASGEDPQQSDPDKPEPETNVTTTRDDQPPYRNPDRLRAVYEREETIAGTATHFDVSYRTARTWLIRHDIFDPDSDGIPAPYRRLQALEPDDVGLPPLGER
ncbi:hypothetical protein [Halomicrococcus sp. NG-SE-24]|uniref:hypothetical protein n=1 Tax=Halomicrococcus sp. NG-SE-24 TaxID=3436928 RepID=UPI003D9519E5